MISLERQNSGFSLEDYMSNSEIKLMKKMIKNKQLTIFRLKKCEAKKCENLILKQKKFCSIECKNKSNKKKKMEVYDNETW